MEKNVLLPKTSFNSKSEWKEKEPKFLKFWKEENVFSTRNEKNNEGEFLLHDLALCQRQTSLRTFS